MPGPVFLAMTVAGNDEDEGSGVGLYSGGNGCATSSGMTGVPVEGISLIQTRIMDGLNRSITVLLSTEINSYLLSFFPVYNMLVLLFALHALLSMSPSTMPGFYASWRLRGFSRRCLFSWLCP